MDHLKCAAEALILLLKPKRFRETWRMLADRANRRALRIPWMDNRRFVFSLDAASLRRISEVRDDP
jgi:hypothetical protein